MQQTWSAFRITLLLYLGVLLLPFSFYYTYNSIQDLTSDTTVMRKISQNGGEMLVFAETSDVNVREKIKLNIDKSLTELSPWFASNEREEFYVGGKTLQKDFKKLSECWNKLKNSPNKEASLACWKSAKSLNFTIDKMLSLKQNKIENFFYINMIIAIIFLLLMIYLVRVYIHLQMKKHAIHDHETQLFNKKYCLAELKTSCARAKRYGYPLSTVSVSITNMDTYDQKTKKIMLHTFGELMRSATRISDVACRYDENHFMILLPDPEENSADQCQERIGKIFEAYNFNIAPKPEFKFSTTHYRTDENEESFMARTLDGLS